MTDAPLPVSTGIAAPGFRLPATARLGAVHLQVASLVRSITYYEQVLGFTLRSRDDGTASLGTADETLIVLRERPGVSPVPRRGRLGLFHFAVLLPDRAALGRLIAHLATHNIQVGMADHLVSEAIYLYDPDGLGIEVYADRPRSTWRYSQGEHAELMMDSHELALASLLEDGGATPWSGMPPGTRIGHIHLSVGSLDAARDFFHVGLGLDLVVWSYPGALFFSAGGYHHHLGTNIWAAGSPAATDADARLIDWQIILDDRAAVERLADHLRSRGQSVEAQIEGIRLGDPWGGRVRVMQTADG